MKIYEFGKENEKTMLMFQCAAEPWWVFEKSAKEMARDFHVFLSIADGHDEMGTEFVSVEKYIDDTVSMLKKKDVESIDLLYGVSLGGACVIRLLAIRAIPVRKAIIDAGITPYGYPKIVCMMIALKDLITVGIACKSMTVMKLACPPRRWTPEGEDPDEHYERIFDFEKNNYSLRTIYNTFWSANNYSMPDPVPDPNIPIEYWYGEEEKLARAGNRRYVRKIFSSAKEREFKGMAHAELVLMKPEHFHREVMKFFETTNEI